MRELVHFSLKRRLSNGAQILLNIILFAVIGCAIFGDCIIDIINPDMLEAPTIYLGDMDEQIKDYLLNQKSVLFQFREKQEKHQIKGTSHFILTQQDHFLLQSQYHVDPGMKEALTAMVSAARQEAILSESKGSNEALNAYVQPILLKNQIKDKNVKGDTNQQNVIFMVITGIYFMMISFATTVANEVVYEKATKTLELILTSVSAHIHFISKMLVGWLVVMFQCLFVGIDILFWLLIRNGYDQGRGLIHLVNQLQLAHIPQKTLLSALSQLPIKGDVIIKLLFVFIFLFVGILLIQLLMVIVSSFISNIEEAGNVQGPFYIIMLGMYYLTIYLNTPYHMNEGIGYYLSFMPFLSMLFMPCRILQGTATFYEMILALAIVLGTFWVLYKKGGKLYQRGVLDYSSKGFFNILKQIKTPD